MGRGITLRDFMRLGAGTWFSLDLWPGRLRASDSKDAENFTFLAVNDLHFADEKECGLWFEKAVLAMKKSAPRAEFCLLCGDIADKGEARQHSGVRTAFAELDLPVHATIGNHDYLTRTDRRSYEEAFKNQIN